MAPPAWVCECRDQAVAELLGQMNPLRSLIIDIAAGDGSVWALVLDFDGTVSVTEVFDEDLG